MTLAISDIELFNLLKGKIGEPEAKVLVEYVESKVETQSNKKFEEAKLLLATKEDLAKLETRIMRSIFLVGLIQYLAILASLIAVIKYLM